MQFFIQFGGSFIKTLKIEFSLKHEGRDYIFCVLNLCTYLTGK